MLHLSFTHQMRVSPSLASSQAANDAEFGDAIEGSEAGLPGLVAKTPNSYLLTNQPTSHYRTLKTYALKYLASSLDQ